MCIYIYMHVYKSQMLSVNEMQVHVLVFVMMLVLVH